MIVPGIIIQNYNMDAPYLRKVAERVKDNVSKFCGDHGFAFVGRMKTEESLAEKIETGRYVSWSQMDDLYACAIVIPTLREEAKVLEHLKTIYHQTELRARGTSQKDPTVFRFDSTRFIGKLNIDEDIAEDSPLRKIQFEVQIRTAFEHAWCVTTHALTYKADKIDWRRLRLTAQLKAAVEQLDSLVLGFDGVAATLSEHNWPEVAAMKQIEVTFRNLIRDNLLPPEILPGSWARFCENLLSVFLGTSAEPKHKAQSIARKNLKLIDATIRSKTEKYPLSLTLIQYCIGILLENGAILGQINRYTPMVTLEMVDLYPKSDLLGAGFKFD